MCRHLTPARQRLTGIDLSGPRPSVTTMSTPTTLDDYLVAGIRQHLEAPGHEPRRWTLPSYAGIPRSELTVVASRDAGRRGSRRRGGGYAHHLHLSFMAHVDGRPALVDDSDLDHWVPLILGAYAPYAHLRPVAQPGSDSDLSPWSTVTTHVDVFLDRRGMPLTPDGPQAVTPWRAA